MAMIRKLGALLIPARSFVQARSVYDLLAKRAAAVEETSALLSFYDYCKRRLAPMCHRGWIDVSDVSEHGPQYLF